VIMRELEATDDRFEVCKQEKNRAPIYEHRATIWLRIWDMLSRKKLCSDWPESDYDFRTLQSESKVNEEIVLRFSTSEYDFGVAEIFL